MSYFKKLNAKRVVEMMDNRFIVIANWKMYFNFKETLDFVERNLESFSKLVERSGNEVVLCPNSMTLFSLRQKFLDCNIRFGAQDCSDRAKGAFTGQTSAESVRQSGCHYCIVGHSERRKYNCETNSSVAKKFINLIKNQISPILCVGENCDEYERGDIISTLESQVNAVLDNVGKCLKTDGCVPICVAYEPVWAIGTGKIPSVEHLEMVFDWMVKKLRSTYQASYFRLIYGGSVTGKNAAELKTVNNLNGFLIGKSSLDFQEFKKIVQCGIEGKI
jgi:triosephosphate isomerase (TIM)